MVNIAAKESISNTLANVRTVSFDEKRNPRFDEEQVNKFLDQIIDFKEVLGKKTDDIIDLVESFCAISWLNNLDEECLMLVNDIISAAKDLHSSLMRQYAKIDFFKKKEIASDEIKRFKFALDDLQEAYVDLESVFFFLPEIEGFVETTKTLSLL